MIMKETIYPIKIERSWKHNYKFVEWQLGNTCNYDCSFCATEIKNGTKYWLDISVYKNFCEKLINEANKENKKVIFQFTGGEPTLYPDLIDLLKYIKNLGGYCNLISNGSRTLRWWREIASEENLLLWLFLTAHPEQNCDIEHISAITKLFNKSQTFILVNCTAPPNYFDKAVAYYDYLLENAFCKVTLKVINPETVFVYTPQQKEILTKKIMINSKNYGNKNLSTVNFVNFTGKMKIIFNDNSTVTDYAHRLMSAGYDKLFGFKCSIGIDNLSIVYDKIYRGMCQQGGVIGSIYDDFTFSTDEITCLKSYCGCASDYHEPKRKI